MKVDASPKSRPRVLHVSGDFPDPIAPFKTPVIRSFVEMSADRFDQEVVSINRKAPGWSSLPHLAFSRDLDPPYFESQPFAFGTATSYLAPGRGILHHSRLKALGEWLSAHIRRLPAKPDLLVAHKLTIEGVAVSHAARKLGIPYALTIQGNTDRRIIAARPDLRETFRSIYLGAAKVLTFTPIARASIETTLGRRADGIRLIPCPTELDEITPPVVGGNGLITVFHLKNYKVKNLQGMARALRRAPRSGPLPALSIIGGGTDDERARCRAITARCPTIAYEGALDRQGMTARMNGATALVQPSLSESFGLVFIEALFAGLPIIYPAGTGIDGYFDAEEFAIRVDPRSPDKIFAAMERANAQEARMKQALAAWQASDAPARFTRQSIAKAFIEHLTESMGDHPAHTAV